MMRAAPFFIAFLAVALPVAAQDAAQISPPAVDARHAELDAIARDMELTEARQAELKREIETLEKDRASLNEALVEGSREVQRLEGEINATEKRLGSLLDDETRLRASLAERRDILSEVLAAVQRMGHRPPPALLVRPEDALASVRSAILLGAVVPDLRSEANRVAGDLHALVQVRTDVETERDRLKADATALAEGRARIQFLIEERQRQRAASMHALEAEQKRAVALAEQATSLKELIARLEQEIATAAAAAAAAEKAAEEAEMAIGQKPAQNLGNADRLAPAVPFAETKGMLPLPVNGEQTIAFGENDGLGGRAQGISLKTRAGTQVSSPADGWVVYAGPFRSYGQLLIINAGDGYHVLLAGMDRIDVQLGQFVLAGEPVAVMAAQQLASLGPADVGASQPVLYVEFRKDGVSIDSAPWWAASNVKR